MHENFSSLLEQYLKSKEYLPYQRFDAVEGYWASDRHFRAVAEVRADYIMQYALKYTGSELNAKLFASLYQRISNEVTMYIRDNPGSTVTFDEKITQRQDPETHDTTYCMELHAFGKKFMQIHNPRTRYQNPCGEIFAEEYESTWTKNPPEFK